jgi:hypothetical protein
MKAKAHIAHSIPGRTRFRIHNRRHHRQFFRDIDGRLARLPQVKSVAADPRTGSVLVHHDGSTLDLLAALATAGLGELVDLEPPAPVARQLREELAVIDGALRRATSGQLDLATVSMFGLAVLAGVQLVRGTQPVIGITLAWYAAELLRRWEEPQETETAVHL